MVIDGHRSERMRQARQALLERVKKRYPSLGKPEDEEGVVPDAVMKKILEMSEKYLNQESLCYLTNTQPLPKEQNLWKKYFQACGHNH